MREKRWDTVFRIPASATLVAVSLLLLSVSGFPTEEIFQGLFPVQPPHCSKTPIVIAQTSQNAHSAIARGMQMQFYIGLHTAVCFRLQGLASNFLDGERNETSLLHTIRLERLEHHHPVTQRYYFGVPEVHAECICECDAQSASCTAESHQFTACPESAQDDPATSCYRTFFPNQTPIGCSEDSSPKLCCDVRFKPYKNMTFLAVKLEQPTTYATFVYTAYDYVNGRWVEKDKSTIRSQLDGGTQDRHLDGQRRISLAVTSGGRASHQLESGMYYARATPGGEMEELRRQPLNEFSDNNFDRLGWYRMSDSGKFHVNNGVVKMDDIHKAKVKNCREQTYRSILSANNYMPGHFNMSKPLEMVLPWVQSARIYDANVRQAVVTHAEGSNLHIALHLDDEMDGQRPMFFHNSSRIRDFSGTIIVDSRSNRFFNLTVYDASGKINGAVKYSAENQASNIHTFTAYVSDLQATNRSMIVPLPVVVEAGPRMICLRADEANDRDAICHVVEFHESPLEIDLIEGKWHEMVGTCPTCNQVNFNGIMKYLNPAAWFKGISSLGDGVMMITDVVVYLGVLIVVYLLITKLVIPLVRCWVCPLHVFASSSSKKKRKRRERSRSRSASPDTNGSARERPRRLPRQHYPSLPRRQESFKDEYI